MYESETEFVLNYIRPDKRERLLHELTDRKKRSRGLDRFCHQSAELIDQKRILLSGSDLGRQEEFCRFVSSHEEQTAILSPNPVLDGIVLPLADAVHAAMTDTDATIVLGTDYALVNGEAMKGFREHYLLVKKTASLRK